MTETGNPIIRHLFTADPAVIEYNGTVYLYTGHDEAPPGVQEYDMHDWRCFSSIDMRTWTEHPVPLRASDFAWARDRAFASQVVQRHSKFYWYVSVAHGRTPERAIGVAVADCPTGPFTDTRGSALITSDMETTDGNVMDIIDPAVIIDNDGQAYLFWGKERCYYAGLAENMTELTSPIKRVPLPDFMKGAHVHKRNGWYYISYGYQFPQKVGYAMSRSIHGPWEFKGILNEIPGNCQTNRPAIIDFKGESYFFYHNSALRDGGSYRRSVCVDYLYYNADGTMKRVAMTSEGV
jgi:beta-xylosidase